MGKYLKKYWFFAFLAPIFMMGEVLMDLLQPRLMSIIVDEGVLGLSNNNVGDLSLVLSTGLKMIGFVVLGGFFGVMSGVFANLCSQNFGNDIRKDAFGQIMSLSFEQTDRFTTGSLITRVTNDITQLQNLVMQCIRGFVRTFMLFAGGIVSLLLLDLSFGVVVACGLPLVVLCAAFFLSKANPRFYILQDKLDRVNNVMQENVSGSRVVKAYVREEHEKNRFETANGDLVGTQLDILLLFSYMTPIMNIILNVSIVAIIKVGSIQVAAGGTTPGNVMAAITYISQILNAVMRAAMIFQTVSRGVASGRRVNEILDCDPAIRDGSFTGDTACRGQIEFRNVSFSYPGMGARKILDNISFTVRPGETFAILGSTGCGKSSMVNLIPRFYDPVEGQVLVDDVDVKDYPLRELRGRIAVSLQKSEIFSTTIGGNIRWGNPDASMEQLNHAAETAQAMEFIRTKAEGMDTPVTQGGTSLSGGQKQRLAISRAVLKDAEILIFDDTTSALDLKTEAKLYAALKREYPHTTKIIIAQRIASVKDADRIAILENGKIAALGTHAQLLAESEIYQDIYHSQAKA
ncbi:MAG: ABC transporter ATP-binding protein/permease [Lachnospiraceae bacterium]|nr:ABC transporter ATP-binding protein/permease [Butyrivibrio sp.]MCM1305414.1 ABC transporter ATP-binding protein/permease [Butyrivibrio sp.]MCM1344404.1 ABC transporter ATP-binding protein/permease [Muribaculaceae bacterium]MCM1411684.1 ABC transporter ATP-binding protein/permease [Lachnospiraceae bacterium]